MNLSVVLAFLFKFAPTLYYDLVEAIKVFETTRLKKENSNAVDESSSTNDERPVEKIINPQHAGEASGRTDSEIIDSIPNF
jgi:hypothetical protein